MDVAGADGFMGGVLEVDPVEVLAELPPVAITLEGPAPQPARMAAAAQSDRSRVSLRNIGNAPRCGTGTQLTGAAIVEPTGLARPMFRV